MLLGPDPPVSQTYNRLGSPLADLSRSHPLTLAYPLPGVPTVGDGGGDPSSLRRERPPRRCWSGCSGRGVPGRVQPGALSQSNDQTRRTCRPRCLGAPWLRNGTRVKVGGERTKLGYQVGDCPLDRARIQSQPMEPPLPVCCGRLNQLSEEFGHEAGFVRPNP
jgi:hypothetical protein